MMMLIYKFDYASVMAVSTIAAIVALLVFFVFQREFVEGLSGGVKS